MSLVGDGIDNSTATDVSLVGWVGSSRDRGSLDVIWSSCLVILLCCWVVTHPNTCAPGDKWYHPFMDKVHLTMIGLLGPDLLLGIAVGQLSSARRSVKAFQEDASLRIHGEWTLQLGFFVDMGGIHLGSPDYPEGFPINTEQLFYLVKHGHVDFPDIDGFNIQERNTKDRLSKFITIWQVTWFLIVELQRLGNGLPMTTLELTAMSYVPMMIAIMACWWHKPYIIKPVMIWTKDGKLVGEIRAEAKATTHSRLPLHPDDWYRTPLDFLGFYRWRIATYWGWFTSLAAKTHLRIFSRPIKTRMWTRFPSDSWLPHESIILVYITPVMMLFSVSFIFAWNFHFPTAVEQTLWRICSIYHAWFSLYGSVYFAMKTVQWSKVRKAEIEESLGPPARSMTLGSMIIHGSPQSDPERQSPRPRGLLRRFMTWLRNPSADGDPEMTLPLRGIIFKALGTMLYFVCRVYLYTEDFISFRTQPQGVYVTVNKYLPFIGD